MAAASRSIQSLQSLLEALAHPTRRRILREMHGKPPASPRELSESLDDSLSNISYHFRVLADSGILELVSTRPVRGSTQHFYGVNIDDAWAREVLALDAGGEPAGRRGGRDRQPAD